MRIILTVGTYGKQVAAETCWPMYDQGATGPKVQSCNTSTAVNQVTTSLLALVLAALLLPLLVLLWATESTEGRTRRLSRSGWSQRRIAEHLGVTRYRVRLALT